MLLKQGERYLVQLKDGMFAISVSTDPNYPGVYIDYTKEEWGNAQSVALIEENPNGTRQYINVHCWKKDGEDPKTIYVKKEE